MTMSTLDGILEVGVEVLMAYEGVLSFSLESCLGL